MGVIPSTLHSSTKFDKLNQGADAFLEGTYYYSNWMLVF